MSVEFLYNTFLSVSRGEKGKPWRARKDFDGFNTTEEGILCKRLEQFFNRFPQITVKEFFQAPYRVYKDEEHFPLKFYLTQKAIACYGLLQKQKQEELPDSDSHIKDIFESLKYLATLCVNENITIEKYASTKNGYTWRCLLDYNDKKINLYVLIALPSFDNVMDSLQVQDKDIYLKNIHKDIVKFKMRLNNSSSAKNIIQEAFKRISNTVRKTLDKTKNDSNIT